MAYGTAKIDGTWSFQTLIVLQFAFVAALLVGYPFFPESPYYLLKKNKEDAARKALNRIHGSGDKDLIDAEVARIQELIDVSKTLEAVAGMDGPPIVQCFKGTNLVCHGHRFLTNVANTLSSRNERLSRFFLLLRNSS